MFIIGSLFLTEADAKNVRDQTGRQVTLSDNPQRIVSLAPSLTEIVFAIGKQDCLKGVTRFSDFPPEAKKLPKVGSYKELELEKILALKPDICLAIEDGNPKDVINKLELLNIPVYIVNPKNINAVAETIIEIGELLNATEKAESVVQDMQSRIERIKNLAETADHRPGVFVQIGIAPIVSVGNDTFIHELITFAGGKNLTEGTTPYPRLNREQILALAPEVFIITSMTRGAVFERVKEEWNQWTEMPAIKNKRIFIVDSDIVDRPTPRLIDGLELMFKLIHPELELRN